MKLAVWPSPPAQALADVLAEAGMLSETATVEPFNAARALEQGTVDLALVPTLDVLRQPDAFDLVPGVALAGERDPLTKLVVGSALDAVETVAFDPRHGQAALLAQLVLKEHYSAKPSFAPADPSVGLEMLLAGHSAALVSAASEATDAVVLDLGQEWTDLTLRPMVWGLLAARSGSLAIEIARRLRDAVQGAAPPDVARTDHGTLVYQFSLDGYAHDGLDEFVNHLYYHGTLADFPDLPFLVIPPDDEDADSDEA
ncbi:MAG: hypothetical protein HKN04_02740 [Rhodothermaceae bacterium]|nr:hypothetical protein [Rhodothermaceae bacterium]